jgi:hypothetical protein
MVLERGDLQVLNEPWSRWYYYGADGPSDRFDEVLDRSRASDVRRRIREAAGRGPVFVKDMAYHPGPHLRRALDEPSPRSDSFLVRHPARALTSLFARWPDFTWDEAGYEAQARAFDHVTARDGRLPPVIDSDELRADPDAVVGAWCDAVGLERRPDALRWEGGLPGELDLWEDWYEGVAASEGFLPPDPDPPPTADELARVDPRLADAVARALPLYERLHVHRLRP